MEVNFLELTKKECIEGGLQTASNDILEAKTNLLDAYMYTLAHIEFLSAYAQAIHSAAMDEYETYGEKEVEKFGRRITKFEAGVKYDFSKCNYPGYDQIVSGMDRDNAHKKYMERLLKAMKSKTVIVNDDTGETFNVIPPVKTSTTKIKISY